MPSLPTPGADTGVWGQEINDFLSVAHASDGSVRPANASWIKARNAANSADLNMWRANSSDYVEFGTTIYRDDFALYTYPKNWISLRRDFGSPGTAGERDGVIRAAYQSKHTGNPSSRMAVCAEADDRYDVVNKTITGAANNGSGLIRITAASHGFVTGDKIAVYGVVGTTEANGLWTITNISSSTFDLQGSTFTNAYVSGGTATNRGVLYGFVAAVGHSLARGGLTGTAANGDDTACFVGFNVGTAKGTDAYYLGRNSGIAGSEWTTAFTCDANADYGIRLNGTFSNYGIDFSAGTFTGGLIRLKNNSSVFGRNAANSADISLFKINASNQLEVASDLVLDANLIMGTNPASAGLIRLPNNQQIVSRNAANSADVPMIYVNTSNEIVLGNGNVIRLPVLTRLTEGTNFEIGTATGTRIGTQATQKIGLWNATPIVQPGSAGGIGGITLSNYTPAARTFDRNSYTMDGIADMVCQVVTVMRGTGQLA